MKTKLSTWNLKNPLSEKRFELLTIHFHNFGNKTEETLQSAKISHYFSLKRTTIHYNKLRVEKQISTEDENIACIGIS